MLWRAGIGNNAKKISLPLTVIPEVRRKEAPRQVLRPAELQCLRVGSPAVGVVALINLQCGIAIDKEMPITG